MVSNERHGFFSIFFFHFHPWIHKCNSTTIIFNAHSSCWFFAGQHLFCSLSNDDHPNHKQYQLLFVKLCDKVTNFVMVLAKVLLLAFLCRFDVVFDLLICTSNSLLTSLVIWNFNRKWNLKFHTGRSVIAVNGVKLLEAFLLMFYAITHTEEGQEIIRTFWSMSR